MSGEGRAGREIRKASCRQGGKETTIKRAEEGKKKNSILGEGK